MAEELTIQITAQDGATRVFKAVEGSAKSMGDAVESAGEQGTSGIQSLTDEIQRLDAEIATVGKAMVGLGAIVTGSLAAPLVMGTRAAWDQVSAVEQATFALRDYGDSADDVAVVLQDLTRYAQDATRSGGIFWSEDLYNSAQQLVIAGAALEEVTHYVEVLSRSVGTTATTWDELNRVVGRVISTGRLTTIEFEQLQQAGFRLDESLRNTTVTAQELFSALDAGLSAGVLAGAAETIQGRLEYLQGSFVRLGQAVLGVNEDLEFVAGGLGDQLVTGIDSLIDGIDGLAPAAAAFGEGIGTIVTAGLRLVDAFAGLSPEVQKFLVVTTGIVGATSLAAGSILLMVGPTVRLGQAIRAMAASRAGVAVLSRAFGPLGLALTGVSVAAWGVSEILQNIEESASGVAEGIGILTEEVERLKLAAEEGLADQVQGIVDALDEQVRILEGSTWSDIAERLGFDESVRWEDVMNPGGLNDQLAIAGSRVDEFANHIVATLNEIPTRAGQEAYLAWIIDLLESIEHTVEGTNLDELIEEGILTPASEVPGVMEGVTDSVDKLAVSVSGLAEELDYLNIRGQFDVAEDVAQLGALQVALGSLGVEAALSEGELRAYNEGWVAFGEALRSGEYDADAMLARLSELQYLLATEQIDEQQFAAMFLAITTGLDDYAIAADGASESTLKLGEAFGDTSFRVNEALAAFDRSSEHLDTYATKSAEAAEAQQQLIDGLVELRTHMEERQQATEEFIASVLELTGLDDPLSMWNISGHASDVMQLTQETVRLGESLDSVLAIYGQIDAMGSRMSAAGGIADALFGPDGDPSDGIGPLRDLYDAGIIGQEQFNAAIQDGIAIQEAAAESEQYLNKIRTDQLPILRETTEAYGEMIREISELDPTEQMVALGWMDEAMQGQVQHFTDLVSQMNNFGDAGSDAIQQVIDSIAATDPVLTAMLEDLGLIEQQLDGSYELSVDAEGAISDMERLNVTLGHLIDTLNDDALGTYALNVEGEDEVDSLRDAILGIPDEVVTALRVDVEAPAGDFLADFVANITGGDGAGTAITVAVGANVAPAIADIAGLQDQPQIDQPVGADTGPALADLDGLRNVEPIEVPVRLSTVVGDAADFLTGALGGLFGDAGGPQDVTVTIDAVDNASGVLAEVQAAIDALPDSITIDLTVSDVGGTHQIAADNLQTLQDRATTLDGTTIDIAVSDSGGTHQIAGDNLNTLIDRANTLDGISPSIAVSTPGALLSIGMLNTVQSAAEAIPNDVPISVGVSGALAAIAALSGVAAAAAAIPPSVSTTITTNRVTNEITNVARRTMARHGGIPGYAHGGVVFEGGEAGPEIAHFAHGGTAVLPFHGLYTAPPNTYISPNNAVGNTYGGDIIVDFSGATFNGTSRADMDAWAEQSLIPNLRRVIQDEKQGQVS